MTASHNRAMVTPQRQVNQSIDTAGGRVVTQMQIRVAGRYAGRLRKLSQRYAGRLTDRATLDTRTSNDTNGQDQDFGSKTVNSQSTRSCPIDR